jgi:hypothetical protein
VGCGDGGGDKGKGFGLRDQPCWGGKVHSKWLQAIGWFSAFLVAFVKVDVRGFGLSALVAASPGFAEIMMWCPGYDQPEHPVR